MGKKKDQLWEYVEKEGARFRCKFCQNDYAGGISRIKSHLAGIRGRDIEICDQVPEDIQAAAYLAIAGSNKREKTDQNASNVEVSSVNSNILASSLKEGKKNSITELCKKKDKTAVDKLVAQHFILNNIAFNVIQTQAFMSMVKGISDYGVGYKLPCYTTLRKKLIPNERMEVEEYVKSVQKSWVATGCTLMSDIWSDKRQRSYINIVPYSPGGAVFMNSFEISKEKKTGHYLKDIVSSVIDKIGSDHVVQFITDNARNFESAGDMLVGKYPRMFKTRCAAHGIQLLLKDIYEDVDWVHKIFDDAKQIETYMYRHQIVLSLMREYTKKELKHPCVTRFASNFLMLQSIMEVENELRLLVASPEWRGLDYSKKQIAKNVVNIIQDTEFWTQGREVLQALEPLVRVLRLVDGDGSTFGYLYEAMERAKESIKQHCGNDPNKYTKILKLFEVRRSGNIIHPIHCAAAFLNPGYMCTENFKEDREMKEGINFMLENLVSDEEKQEFIGQLQLYLMKLSNLFTSTAMTMLKSSHPRVWWDYCGDVLPILKKYAIRILSQPCSSSSCERNWSAFEAAQTKKRNRLAPEMLDNLVYVRMNTMMMEKFNTMEARDLQPIDLEKLGELPEYVDQEEDLENNSSDDNNEDDNGNGIGDLHWL